MVYSGEMNYVKYEKNIADKHNGQFMGDILPVDLENEVNAWSVID